MTNRLCLILLLLSGGAIAQDTLTIDKAIQIALQNNYAIKIADRNKQVAENNYTRGNAGFLPVVNASATKNYSNSNLNQVFFPTGGVARPPLDASGVKGNTFNSGVNFTWTIFNGLGMFYAYNRLDEQKKSSLDSLQIVMENTLATVSNNYYNVIQQNQRLNVLNSALRISAQRLDLAKAQYEVGSGSKLNYLAAQVDFNTDSSTVILQAQSLQNAKVGLNQALSREANAAFLVSDTIIVDEKLDLATLKQNTFQNNPSLLQIQRRSNIAYYQMKQLYAQRFPTINLLSSYNYTTSEAAQGFGAQSSKNLIWNYGLGASINIFNGFNLNRQIQNAKIQQEITDLRIKDLQVQLDASLETAYNNYRNSLSLLSIEKRNLEVARQNIDIALERYKIGVATFLELRDVQLNSITTAGRLIDAEFNTKLAEIELLRLSSQIIMETPTK
ncbi:MAG: TolC family protein [Bacteroidota bacterium]